MGGLWSSFLIFILLTYKYLNLLQLARNLKFLEKINIFNASILKTLFWVLSYCTDGSLFCKIKWKLRNNLHLFVVISLCVFIYLLFCFCTKKPSLQLHYELSSTFYTFSSWLTNVIHESQLRTMARCNWNLCKRNNFSH